LLFTLFPHKAHAGFRAYYDHCTPRQIEALAHENGLVIEDRRLYWTSSYFQIFTPAFVLWRISQLFAYAALRDNAAEMFSYVFRKRDREAGGSMGEAELTPTMSFTLLADLGGWPQRVF
jgi:hypothetical protein